MTNSTITKPEVGSKVEILSDRSASMRGYASNVPRKHSLVGTVIASEAWVDDNSFTLYTGTPGFPKSVVSMHLVTQLKYLDDTVGGEAKEKAPDVNIESFLVPGSTGNTYTVTHHGDLWECTCVAGQHGRLCKHVTAAKLGNIARTSVTE